MFKTKLQLELCDDDYISKLIEGNKNVFSYIHSDISINGNLMEYDTDEKMNANFERFSEEIRWITGINNRDIEYLCNFNYNVRAGASKTKVH